MQCAIVERKKQPYIIKRCIGRSYAEMQENIEESKVETKKIVLPVLPLRDVVVYPKMIVPIFVGREMSIEAVQKANDKGQKISLAMYVNSCIFI